MRRQSNGRLVPAAAIVAAIFVGVVSLGTDAVAKWSKTSLKGQFRITVASLVEPPRANRMHNWTALVETPDGKPVTDARIAITGAAPDIARPLPTAPRVTRHLGGGRYLIEGVRFNMPGRWRLDLAVESGHLKDKIKFDFDVR